jgi:hypothetical protein
MGGDTDLTNHHAARKQIVAMLTNCPSMVDRNRKIAAGLVDTIRIDGCPNLRTSGMLGTLHVVAPLQFSV